MTSATPRKMTFARMPEPVQAPLELASFDLLTGVEWFSDLIGPAIRRIARLSSALCEPVKELAPWQVRNGLVSSLELSWITGPTLGPASEYVEEDDPILQLGKHPIVGGVPDASENHDRYIYG